MIEVWTDGGARGNGDESNIGAWAYTANVGGVIAENSSWEFDTTNNKMEMKAVVEALKFASKKSKVARVYSDSQYVVKGMNEWLDGWSRRGWKTANKKPVKNKELWLELVELKDKFFSVEFVWVKGHADSDGNNRADALVNIAMDEGERSVSDCE